MTVSRATIVAAIIGALMAIVVNVATISRWTGTVDQHFADLEKRFDRLEDRMFEARPVAHKE